MSITELSIKNHHERDDHISFQEEGHKYTIDNDATYKSVTTWIHSFFPKFNTDSIIKKMKEGQNWENSKYNGMTDQEIKDCWNKIGKEASSLGTKMHSNIENFYNGKEFDKDFVQTPEYKLFNKYLQDHTKYIPYRTEWPVYSKKYKLAGSIDCVYYDPNSNDPNSIIIADWKRCKEIVTHNNFDNGFGPLSNIPHCNYWHYTLQLNIYRMILEKYYGKKVTDMFLIVLHPNNDNYIKIKINRISEPIIHMLEQRKKEIT